MVEPMMIDLKALLLEREDCDAGTVQQIRNALAQGGGQYRTLRDVTETIKKKLESASGAAAKRWHLKLGIASFFLGYTGDAVEHLKQAEGALANYYLGEIARTEGELGQAEASYRRSLACDPANQNAHMHLGMVLQDQKHYPEAIRQFKEAIRLEPNESSAHYHLGSVYKQLGRTAEARAEYRKVREIQSASDTGTDVTRTDR